MNLVVILLITLGLVILLLLFSSCSERFVARVQASQSVLSNELNWGNPYPIPLYQSFGPGAPPPIDGY